MRLELSNAKTGGYYGKICRGKTEIEIDLPHVWEYYKGSDAGKLLFNNVSV